MHTSRSLIPPTFILTLVSTVLSGCGLGLSARTDLTCQSDTPLRQKLDEAIDMCGQGGGYVVYQYSAQAATCCPDGDAKAQAVCLVTEQSKGSLEAYRIEASAVDQAWCGPTGWPQFVAKPINDVVAGLGGTGYDPNDTDGDGVSNATDQCPTEPNSGPGIVPDPKRPGCPYKLPSGPCYRLERDKTIGSYGCVPNKSTRDMVGTALYQAPYTIQNGGVYGSLGVAANANFPLGVLVLNANGQNIDLCSADGQCVQRTGNDTVIHLVGRSGDELTSVRAPAGAQLRRAYQRPDGETESVPCTTPEPGIPNSCKP